MLLLVLLLVVVVVVVVFSLELPCPPLLARRAAWRRRALASNIFHRSVFPVVFAAALNGTSDGARHSTH